MIFPLQQWLHERASMLRYTYIACLVMIHVQTLWKCMTCNLLKFTLQIISNKIFKRRIVYIAYCTEHSVSMTNYTLENNVVCVIIIFNYPDFCFQNTARTRHWVIRITQKLCTWNNIISDITYSSVLLVSFRHRLK